jgi:nicotinamidase/pyrazinamidase
MENLKTLDTHQNACLLVIDVQLDFLPGGALAVPDGDAVIPVICGLIESGKFGTVVATQDWHPAGHRSFASSTPGAEPFTLTQAAYGPQTLWPDHCVQGTPGATIMLPPVYLDKVQAIVRKGFRPEVDSYSAFMENDRKTRTGLAEMLRERGVTKIFIAGLALDYCVNFSAIDARAMGFDVMVILEGCRGIADESVKDAMSEMTDCGVRFI